MANHREAYWRWLILGLRGLVAMVEAQAGEQTPPPELAAQLAEHSRRLAVVAGRFEKRD